MLPSQSQRASVGLLILHRERLPNVECLVSHDLQFLGSGKHEPFVPYEEPVSVLKEGVLYSGENGMIICRKCARLQSSQELRPDKSRYAATPWQAGVRASSGFDPSTSYFDRLSTLRQAQDRQVRTGSSGNTILALPRSVNAEFKKMFGEDMHCEKGCTVYTS